MSQTSISYIEKLESHFNPAFIATPANQYSKQWETVSYVKMLEQMCKDQKIEVKREYFPTINHFVYAKDQFGEEKRWTLEEETDTAYKIFHYEMVTMIAKSRVCEDHDGRLVYDGKIYVDEEMNRMSLDFIQEMYETNAVEAGVEVG